MEQKSVESLFRIAHIIGARHVRLKSDYPKVGIELPPEKAIAWNLRWYFVALVALTALSLFVSHSERNLPSYLKSILAIGADLSLILFIARVFYETLMKPYILNHANTRFRWRKFYWHKDRKSLPIRWILVTVVLTTIPVAQMTDGYLKSALTYGLGFGFALCIYFPLAWAVLRPTYSKWLAHTRIDARRDRDKYLATLSWRDRNARRHVLAQLEGLRQDQDTRLSNIGKFLGGVISIAGTGIGVAKYVLHLQETGGQDIFPISGRGAFWIALTAFGLIGLPIVWYSFKNPIRQLDRAIFVFKQAIDENHQVS